MAKSYCTRHLRSFGIVLCMHISMMLWTGLTKALGVMLPTLREQFSADTWIIGGLIAAVSATAGFAGPLSGPLDGTFGTRTAVVTSGLLSGVSLILSSFSTHIFHIALILCFLAGPALFITSILTRAMAGRHFTTGYAMAIGIGSSGHALAMMIIGPLTQVFLDVYGWRSTFQLLGAISLHLWAFAFLLRSPPNPAQARNEYLPIAFSEERELSTNELRSLDAEKRSCLRSLKGAIKAVTNQFGCSVCGRAEFWIAFPVFGCDSFAIDMWLMYFVAYANTKGFSGYEAVTFTLAGGIGNIVSKIIFGLILDQGLLQLRLSLFVTIIASSLSLLLLPWMNTYWMMMINAFLYHGLSGIVTTLSDIYTRDLLGAEDLVPAFSWIGVFTAALVLAFGIFPGLMFDKTGSYDLAFVILGCVASLPLVSLFAEVLLNRRRERSL
ncbi:monocarboxylate transporter 12-like [Acanthaster planci]|uniref:Monocarboxylate transporter 12-like n=1 Tax=Acanthaster planci TaxID=133434 RepID=A0A8B7Z368_ACAPL|nr:monocarboxylate transporter 12-like [Acanthaster planci]